MIAINIAKFKSQFKREWSLCDWVILISFLKLLSSTDLLQGARVPFIAL